jgi:hypothetical protein
MLIGLTGRAGAGKDTVHETLVELYGDQLPVERRSFADPLYESAAAALGVTVNDLRRWKNDPDVLIDVSGSGDAYPHSRQTVRQFLQRYGTEAHRDVFGEGFWTDAVDLAGHRGTLVAVTDVRFVNEAEAVRAAGGIVVRVLGPNEGPVTHPSERPLPATYVDYVLHNAIRDDNRRYLRKQVAALVTWGFRFKGQMPPAPRFPHHTGRPS